MLINAKKWREENISDKLMQFTEDYPEKLLFNDQDTLNVILQDGIKYLDKRWNALASAYSIAYFNDVADTAFIIHYTTHKKPWTPGSMSPMKHEYFRYLRNTPWQSKKLIVSLTSYPARISCVPQVLKTIFNQTLLPDEIVLWLGKDRFPNRLADLPEELKNFIEKGELTIRWVQDIGPHTKYFYAFKEYPDALLITVDDDILYQETIIESLYQSYLQHPNAVSASRARLIGISDDGLFFPFNDWLLLGGVEDNTVDLMPSMSFLAEGVEGCLYPTGLFEGIREDLLDIPAIQRTCPNNDDLWLKVMQLVADIPVVVTKGQKRRYVPESQELGLWRYNVLKGGTDYEWSLIQKEIDRRYGKAFLWKKLNEPPVGKNYLLRENLYQFLVDELNKYDVVVKKVNRSYAKYSTLRIDIRNRGKEGGYIQEELVDPPPSRLVRPSWLPDGVSIESTAENMKVALRCQGEGELDIRLRGRDERNEDGRRYPVWIDCTYFAVNGEVVFEGAKTICHDRPYIYRRPVKDGEVVELSFRWSECRSNTVLEETFRLQSEVKALRGKVKETESKALQLQDAITESVRLSSETASQKKVLEKQKKRLSQIISQMQGFRMGSYLKYKVLSKLTFGDMRSRYRVKYQEQKKIYRKIKKGSR